MPGTTDLLAAQMAALDEDVLHAIIDSASMQCQDLAGRPGHEARTMFVVLSLIAVAAEAAVLRRQTGVAV